MSNFRTRILGLATLATAFVGMSYGQVVICGTGTNVPAGATAPTAFTGAQNTGTAAGVSNLGTQVNPSLRAESQTEMLAVYQFNCTVVQAGAPAAPATPTAASQTTGTVYVNTNLPITSKALTGGANEATIIINGTTTVVAPNGQITLGNGRAVGGTVSGNQVTFLLPTCTVGDAVNCPIPDYPAVGVFEVTNVRVNASSAGSPQVTETGLLSYVVPQTTQGLITANLALTPANGPGYILKSLTNLNLGSVAANYLTCVGNSTGISFYLNMNQLIPDPFLGVGSTGSSATTAVSLLPGSEVGQYVTGANVGTANADQIVFTISNLPASATVYVPQTTKIFGVAAAVGPPAVLPNNFILTLVGSTVAASGPGTITAPVAFTPTSGTVTIAYTVQVAGGGDQTTLTSAADSTQIPVVVAFAANSALTQGAITANYFYGATAAALSGPATAIPTFAVGSLTAQNGPGINNCQTTLLFPFVTNQVGFDSGIVFANTSVDNLGNPTFTKSAVAAQSGTCQMFFYGTTAPTPAGPIADPQGSLASGNVHAFQLSAVASGYQGYMIAVCPFQYAHGFAFLTNAGTAGTSAVVQGYLAEVLGNGDGLDRGQSNADANITF